MMHLGDYDASAVIYGKFTTYRPSTGAPYTLAGTPAISVYKDNSTTQSTTGVTLTADFDSVTGLNHFAIDTSADGTFYAAGSFFDVVITTGTVDSVSAVGTVVGRFTLRKSSALKPTTAGRTLDVTATGEAGIDWANVGSPTTTLNLSGTTVSTSQAVASVSGAVGSVTGAVGSVAAGGITASSIAADAIGASELAADAVAEIADAVWDEVLSGHLTGGSTGNALNAAGSAGDPWGTAIPGAYSAGSAGYILGNNLDAAVTSRLAPTTSGRTLDVTATGEAGIDWSNVGSPTTTLNLSGTTISTSQAVASVSGAVGSVTGAVGSVTGNVGGSVASVASGGITSGSFAAGAITAASIATGAIDADALASDAVDEIWAKAMTELSGVPAVTGSVLQALSWCFSVARNKLTQTSTTQTVLKDDGTTTLATSAVSDDGTTFTRGEFS